jgi:hypothetical protein
MRPPFGIVAVQDLRSQILNLRDQLSRSRG